MICEAPRMAASSENLLLEAQPPIHYAVNPHTHHTKNVKDTDVDVGDLQVNFPAEQMKSATPGNYRAGHHRGQHGHTWSQDKQEAFDILGTISSFMKSFSPSATG